MIINFETLNQVPLVDPITTPKDIETPIIKVDLEEAGAELEVPISSLDDLKNLLDSDDNSIFATIDADLEIAKNDKLVIKSGKDVHLKVDSTITCNLTGFDVQDGATLTLSGNGTIQTKNKKTAGAIVEVAGSTSKVIIDGVTLDTITLNGKANNYSYAIYAREDADVDFVSGTIRTAYGSGISTNGTTGGATTINILGGQLLCDGSYAIYLPTQSTINIKGDAKVQGINVRMGVVNIEENAQIIPTTITEADYDNIGKEFATSGCVWLGDTIAVMAGTYTDVDGTQCIFNIKDNATVKSNFRAAIGIYEVDINQPQDVTFNIANAANITTTAEGFNAIEVYNHDYIAEQAQAAGKTYNPTVQSTVIVNS